MAKLIGQVEIRIYPSFVQYVQGWGATSDYLLPCGVPWASQTVAE